MSRVSARSVDPAPVFAALGSATRLELVSRLSDGDELSITALTNDLDLTRQAISKHLGVLQQAGVVSSRRVGRESRFSIRPESISNAENYLRRVSAQWDDAIARLQAAVEQRTPEDQS